MDTLSSPIESVTDASTASSLVAQLLSTAASAEQQRKLSDEVMQSMRAANLFCLWRPKALGGRELSAVQGLELVEELARYDSSAAWNVQICAAVDLFGAWFPDEVAQRTFSGTQSILSGSLNPPFAASSAVRKDAEGKEVAGYELEGHAPFASGVGHSDWLIVLAAVEGEGAGVYMAMIPRAEIEIDEDSWQTLGMCATGSCDIRARGLFVDKRHMVPLAPRSSTTSAYSGQLYRLSIWPLVAALAAPSLGVARAAIDDLVGLATVKTPFYTGKTLRDRELTQSHIARAQAKLGATRAYFYEALNEAWAAVAEPGSALSIEQKQKVQLACCHAVEQAAEVVAMCYALAGSSGFRKGKDPRSDMNLRFERHLRDANTMKQHAFTSLSRYESVGKLMLGLETDWPFFGF